MLFVQRLQQIQNFVAGFPVQIAGRFVAQQQGGISHDGARDTHSLLFTAGELPRIKVLFANDLEAIERVGHERGALAARHVVVPFDQIEDFVAARNADAGLLIHEGQLTFADRGLHLWADMGEWWYQETRLPLPLGGNVVRRDLGAELMRAIARDLKASIEYGLASPHRAEALRYAQGFSRGLDVARTDRFVRMYVNAYTVDYGTVGRHAVAELLARAHTAKLIPAPVDLAFISADS